MRPLRLFQEPVIDRVRDGYVEDEGGHYPSPFQDLDMEDYEDTCGRLDMPRTVIELKMCALSASIREKEQWHVKMRDPEIRARWRTEALQQQQDLPETRQLTSEMVDYVLAELEGYVKLRDKSNGIEMGCWERTWRSDMLVSESLRSLLRECVAKLEEVPETEKDWHPGSNGQVLDLVHPSLYPLVYGRTKVLNIATKETRTVEPPEFASRLNFESARFQWLPSDFKISQDGSVSLVSPYINNLDRFDNAPLYEVLENLVSLAVPLWNRVLSDLRRPLTGMRIRTEPIHNNMYDLQYCGVPCIWPKPGGRPYPPEEIYGNEELEEQWAETQKKRLPQALPAYEGALDSVTQEVDLSGETLQVIVKLANIHLTPDSPEYKGGSWHVEGMLNEHIVSTFIYYYDEENLSESRLAFRTATAEPTYHGQDDSMCMRILYDMDRDSACVQDRGSIVTKAGRCIAFPNVYQHQVQPFRLLDPTKPGHRKIVAFFLVDPAQRIPSATEVPMQQRDRLVKALGTTSAMQALPVELRDMTADYVDGFSHDEALEFRLKLMKERTAMIDTMQGSDGMFRGHLFNMCEH